MGVHRDRHKKTRTSRQIGVGPRSVEVDGVGSGYFAGVARQFECDAASFVGGKVETRVSGAGSWFDVHNWIGSRLVRGWINLEGPKVREIRSRELADFFCDCGFLSE